MATADDEKLFLQYFWYMVTEDTEFLKRFHRIIDPGTFVRPEEAWLAKTALDYYVKYREAIPADALTILLNEQKKNTKFDEEIVADLYNEAKEPEGSMRDFVMKYAGDFFKGRAAKEMIGTFADYLADGRLAEALSQLDSSQKILHASTDEETRVVVENTEPSVREMSRIVAATVADNGRAVGTGLETLDRILQGGLRKKELGVVIAPPNRGKSQMLVYLAREAWTRGFNVIYYSFQMDARRIVARFYSKIANVNAAAVPHDQVSAYVNAEGRHVGQFSVQRYPDSGATVADLEANIEMNRDRGERVDLIVIDYADIILSNLPMSATTVAKQKQVYTDLHTLAIKHDLPIWTASQTNRGSLGKKVITVADIADGSDKVKAAHFIMALCQDDAELAAKRMRLYIAKVRNNEGVGTQIECTTDFGQSDIREGR